MIWHLSHRADQRAREIADRHYNRQKIGAPQFVPPGRCHVLYGENEAGGKAFWVTSWPFAEYVKHAWAGAWVCSAFRNEGLGEASDLIRQAVASTLFKYPDVPELGMITFIDMKKVRPIRRWHKDVWGYTYMKAGFRLVGKTKAGLLAFQLLPEDMPAAEKELA